MENRVRELRLQNDITQEELANACKISRSTVAEIERGRTPSGDVMLAISRFFGKDPRDVFLDNRVISTIQNVYDLRIKKNGARASKTKIATK